MPRHIWRIQSLHQVPGSCTGLHNSPPSTENTRHHDAPRMPRGAGPSRAGGRPTGSKPIPSIAPIGLTGSQAPSAAMSVTEVRYLPSHRAGRTQGAAMSPGRSTVGHTIPAVLTGCYGERSSHE
jgi:hypothetical protein